MTQAILEKIQNIVGEARLDAAREMDNIRRRHKVKRGEKTSTEIIRYFRTQA